MKDLDKFIGKGETSDMQKKVTKKLFEKLFRHYLQKREKFQNAKNVSPSQPWFVYAYAESDRNSDKRKLKEIITKESSGGVISIDIVWLLRFLGNGNINLKSDANFLCKTLEAIVKKFVEAEPEAIEYKLIRRSSSFLIRIYSLDERGEITGKSTGIV